MTSTLLPDGIKIFTGDGLTTRFNLPEHFIEIGNKESLSIFLNGIDTTSGWILVKDGGGLGLVFNQPPGNTAEILVSRILIPSVVNFEANTPIKAEDFDEIFAEYRQAMADKISAFNKVVEIGAQVKRGKVVFDRRIIEQTRQLEEYIKAIEAFQEQATKAQEASERARQAAVGAKEGATTSETNAKTSEDNAKTSEDNAKTSETNAETSEDNAVVSATAAETTRTNLQSIFGSIKLIRHYYPIRLAHSKDGDWCFRIGRYPFSAPGQAVPSPLTWAWLKQHGSMYYDGYSNFIFPKGCKVIFTYGGHWVQWINSYRDSKTSHEAGWRMLIDSMHYQASNAPDSEVIPNDAVVYMWRSTINWRGGKGDPGDRGDRGALIVEDTLPHGTDLNKAPEGIYFIDNSVSMPDGGGRYPNAPQKRAGSSGINYHAGFLYTLRSDAQRLQIFLKTASGGTHLSPEAYKYCFRRNSGSGGQADDDFTGGWSGEWSLVGEQGEPGDITPALTRLKEAAEAAKTAAETAKRDAETAKTAAETAKTDTENITRSKLVSAITKMAKNQADPLKLGETYFQNFFLFRSITINQNPPVVGQDFAEFQLGHQFPIYIILEATGAGQPGIYLIPYTETGFRFYDEIRIRGKAGRGGGWRCLYYPEKVSTNFSNAFYKRRSWVAMIAFKSFMPDFATLMTQLGITTSFTGFAGE